MSRKKRKRDQLVLLSLLLEFNPLRIKETTTSRSGSLHLQRWSIPKDHDPSFPPSSYCRIFDFFRSFSKSRAVAPSTHNPHSHTRIFCPPITSSTPTSPNLKKTRNKTQNETRVYSRLADILNHTQKRGKNEVYKKVEWVYRSSGNVIPTEFFFS
jgi:hypothetical protein